MRPRARANTRRPTKAIATNTPTTPNRVVNTSAPVGPWSVLMPTMSANSPHATTAAMTASFSAAARAVCLKGSLSRRTRSPFLLHLLDFRPAENPGRQEDEYDDEDGESRDVLVLDREIGRPHGFDQADADAAEHGGRKGFHAGEKADEEIDDAVIKEEHEAGDGGERRSDHEGERDGAVDIDARERCHLQVLLAGAHVAAEPG